MSSQNTHFREGGLCWLMLLCLFCSPSALPDDKSGQRRAILPTVVHNRRNPSPPAGTRTHFSMKEDLTIGESEKGEGPLLAQINSIDVDDNGNIYALDIKACTILVFNKLGELTRRIGGKGQGPGEMTLPTSLSLDAQNVIIVYDVGNARMTSYSADGKFVRQWNTAAVGGVFIRIVPDSAGGFYGMVSIAGNTLFNRLMRFDKELKPIGLISEISYPRGSDNEATFFSPSMFFTVVGGDKLIWGEWHKYELFMVAPDGRAIKRIIKDYRALRVTNKYKENEIAARYGKGGIPPGLKAVFPEYLPAFRFIVADDDGRLYVRTFEKATNDWNFYDVFNSDGVYIAKIPLPHHPATIKKGKFYMIETTEAGLQVVKRYAFEWN